MRDSHNRNYVTWKRVAAWTQTSVDSEAHGNSAERSLLTSTLAKNLEVCAFTRPLDFDGDPPRLVVYRTKPVKISLWFRNLK